MEKYSKSPFQNFVKAIKGFSIEKPKSEDKATADLHNVASVTKILVNLSKVASAISEDINPLLLKSILFKEYGSEWLDWLPEVLEQELLKKQKSDILSNKAQALRISFSTEAPWKEWNVFEKVGASFNHRVPDFNNMLPLSVGECETTLRTLKELRDETLSEEVLDYIATVAFTNNLVYLPSEWEIGQANDKLSNLVFDYDLKNKTHWAWAKISKKTLIDKAFNESGVQRQLALLATIKQFIEEF